MNVLDLITFGGNEVKITTFDGVADDEFGNSVAIDTNYFVGGAARNNNVNGFDAGAVYVGD